MIPKNEALEYHIISYLQDMTILKNKIELFLTSVKNLLKKEFPNDKKRLMNYMVT